MKNPLRAALARGEILTGLIVFSGSPMVVELAAAAGLRFVILDLEHSALDLDRCAHLIRAADAADIVPLVRIPDVDASLIKKLLNLGAAGLCVPHATPERCAATLRAARYPPEGERGVCTVVRSTGYAPGDWDGHARHANAEVMVVPLLEDAAAIEHFADFAAMPGVDVFFVGPTDLSIALGVPHATFDDPTLGAALDRVVAAARRAGKHVMTTIGNRPDPDYGRSVVRRGVQLVVLGTDGHLLLDALQRLEVVSAKQG